MIDAAGTVFAVADGDHSGKPRVALVGRLEPGRWSHITFIEGQSLALGQTLAAVCREFEDAVRLVVNEHAVIGAHGGANIHAAGAGTLPPPDRKMHKLDGVSSARFHARAGPGITFLGYGWIVVWLIATLKMWRRRFSNT